MPSLLSYTLTPVVTQEIHLWKDFKLNSRINLLSYRNKQPVKHCLPVWKHECKVERSKNTREDINNINKTKKKQTLVFVWGNIQQVWGYGGKFGRVVKLFHLLRARGGGGSGGGGGEGEW